MFCEFYEVCYDLIVSNHRVIFQLKHNSAVLLLAGASVPSRFGLRGLL